MAENGDINTVLSNSLATGKRTTSYVSQYGPSVRHCSLAPCRERDSASFFPFAQKLTHLPFDFQMLRRETVPSNSSPKPPTTTL
jgi:hypothetical protein